MPIALQRSSNTGNSVPEHNDLYLQGSQNVPTARSSATAIMPSYPSLAHKSSLLATNIETLSMRLSSLLQKSSLLSSDINILFERLSSLARKSSLLSFDIDTSSKTLSSLKKRSSLKSFDTNTLSERLSSLEQMFSLISLDTNILCERLSSLENKSSLLSSDTNLLSEKLSAARDDRIARRSASPSSNHSSARSSYVSPEPWQLFSEEETGAFQRFLETLSDLPTPQNEFFLARKAPQKTHRTLQRWTRMNEICAETLIV